MTFPDIAAVCTIFLSASLLQGLTGFGSALLAMPLLTLFMDFKSAVPLCLLNGMIITGFLTFQLRRHLTLKNLGPLLAGALPGIVFGTFLLKNLPVKILQICLGLLLVLYCTWALLRPPLRRKLGLAWSYTAGFASGAIGAAISASGPPVIIFASLADWDKDEVKSTLSGFFLSSGLATLASQYISGLLTPHILYTFTFTAPWVMAGTWLGSMVYKQLDARRYLRLVILTLLGLGIVLIVRAVKPVC